ncbi:MAG TPA: TIGR00300 family protein [Acidimicrobiales bacterium]|jgi:lysine-ketoglutarate reductase/saccharopine dehydrogenase-like protein (TIGR00300 family)
METETVELSGHIIDSLLLAKVLDMIVEAGADYEMTDVDIGRTNADASSVQLEISALDRSTLDRLLENLQVHGVNRRQRIAARLVACERDGVLPAGFYSTTNLPTRVMTEQGLLTVENLEMDCALVVRDSTARTVPMHRVRAGDLVVVGLDGVAVTTPSRPRGSTPFEFMASEVSSEKPKTLLVARVAERLRAARAAGGKILVVAGPAVIHTGAGPDLARLVRAGWVEVLFAGNGFATHDIESNVLGTSLGVSVNEGTPTEHGHANHLRAINEVRRAGSIAASVASGWLSGGVMYECDRAAVPFVLAGSLRDDGPLPDVVTDVVEAADKMRELISGVTVAVMLASTLHAIATGNILPAWVETYCVDINQAVVTKLADRGSHQALGIVTDVGLFIRELAEALVPLAGQR